MPNRKRKQNAKGGNKSGAKKPVQAAAATASVTSVAKEQVEEESKAIGRASYPGYFEDDEESARILSTQEIKAMVEATAEYADSNQFSSYGDLSRHMQNTISQMRGDKTVTETTASVSNEGGGIKRNVRIADDDELGLSQLASAVNQISASQSQQNSVITGQGSRMIQLEDEIDGQHLQNTQIYEISGDQNNSQYQSSMGGDDAKDGRPAMISNLFESSALKYEKVQQIPVSHENTFIREEGVAEADTSTEQIKLFTPLLLQQLMLNSEQILNQKIGNREKNFAPFDFTESMLDSEAKVDHFIGAQFDAPKDGQKGPAPVLGLNYREYFQKRHLVDQLPVEPLPPIENPLEMTQNHEDWVRGQEDFKINLEQLQSLQRPSVTNGRSSGSNNIFPSELAGDLSANFFKIEAQKELAAYNENMKGSASSFDIKSWETLTQAHKRNRRNTTNNVKIDEAFVNGMSMTKNEEQMQQLLEMETFKELSNSNKDNSSQSLRAKTPQGVAENDKTDTGVFLLQELGTSDNLSSYSLPSQTFIEHATPKQIQSFNQKVSNQNKNGEIFMNGGGAQESSISKDLDRDSQDNFEQFISQPELQQLLQLESSLFNLLQDTNISEFMVPKKQSSGGSGLDFNEDDEYESLFEPQAPQIGGSLKNLENYLIRGDLRNCVLCNTNFTEGDPSQNIPANLPRVLYCGDSLCESCISKQIQRASITENQKHQNVAACQVICPVCDVKHIFKLTKTGFLVCNDKYIKVQDEKGPVNFFPSSKINPSTFQLDKDTLHLNLMDQSISIPNSLVIRSLPINVELLDLLKTTRKVQNPSQIELSRISHTPKARQSQKANSEHNVTPNAPKEKDGVALVEDLDEHMSAFNVKEFVEEYEKEILKRFASFDNASKTDQSTDFQKLEKHQKNLNSQTLVAAEFDSKTNLKDDDDTLDLFNFQNDLAKSSFIDGFEQNIIRQQSQNHKIQYIQNTLNSEITTSQNNQAQELTQILPHKEFHPNITMNPKIYTVADLHEQFKSEKESLTLEEKARKRKEQQRKKLLHQVSQQSKPQTFKSHSSANSSILTQSAGVNSSAQAIFKRKQRKKQFLHINKEHRRDSSYSTSSDELMDHMRSFGGAIRSSPPTVPTLFQGAGAQNLVSRKTNLQNIEKANNIIKLVGSIKLKKQAIHNGGDIELLNDSDEESSKHQYAEQLIPLDLDVEQLGEAGKVFMSTQMCDRLSDDSDLSPEELASENSLKRVSLEMLQAASHQQNVLPAQLFPTTEESTAARMFFMNSVLATKDSEKNMLLQSLPEDNLIERKRQMRWAQEERRREKKKNSKEAEIEESKQKHQKIVAVRDSSTISEQILPTEKLWDSIKMKSEFFLQEDMKQEQISSEDGSRPSNGKDQNFAISGESKLQKSQSTMLVDNQQVYASPFEFSTSQQQEIIYGQSLLLAQLQQNQQMQKQNSIEEPSEQPTEEEIKQAEDKQKQRKRNNNRRNKKKQKERKQMLLQQNQQLAELMNGHQVSENNDADLYTYMVPVEETQLQPDIAEDGSMQGVIKFNYVLTERDYFDSDQLVDIESGGFGGSGKVMANNSITLDAPEPGCEFDDQLRMSISCTPCSRKNRNSEEMTLWYRCDSKSDNVSFDIFNGQAEQGQAFQFNKPQLQVLKELVDLGLPNLPSHYCETCNASKMHPETADAEAEIKQFYKDVTKMCLCCTVQHRLDQQEHKIVMIMPVQLLTQQLKRSEVFEYNARRLIGQLQKRAVLGHVQDMVKQLQVLILPQLEIKDTNAGQRTNKQVIKKGNQSLLSENLPRDCRAPNNDKL